MTVFCWVGKMCLQNRTTKHLSPRQRHRIWNRIKRRLVDGWQPRGWEKPTKLRLERSKKLTTKPKDSLSNVSIFTSHNHVFLWNFLVYLLNSWGKNTANQLMLVAYPIIYRVLAPSQVVGNGISEPSTVVQNLEVKPCSDADVSMPALVGT